MRRYLLFALALLCVLGTTQFAQAQAVTGDLEAGIRAYVEDGDPREAIRQIATALDAGEIATTSRARAHVYLAHAFLALGDSLSALPHIQSAIAAQPCLLPSADLAPPEWIRMYERARPANASCGSRMLGAGLRSMVVPGWGQLSLGRSTPSTYFFASTVAAAGAALFFQRRADQRYSDYQGSADLIEVTTLYNQAEGARRGALVLGGVATALYAWNVVDALLAGASRDRSIAAVRAVALSPVITATPAGATLALRISWD